MQHPVFKYELEVQDNGRLELKVPLPKGTRVTVFIVQESPDDFSDLVLAATTSLDFWDNPIDDEKWNNLFRESVTLKPAEASFRQGWQEAQTGQTRPISELWEGIDAVGGVG